MKALFCYDGPLYKDENGDFYDSILTDKMFERYFEVADTLGILIRTRSIKSDEAVKKMHKLENPNIQVTELPNLSSISGLLKNRAKAKKILEENIKAADLVFIRLPSVIGNIAVDAARKYNKKYLIEVVGCPWDSYWNYSFKGKCVAVFATDMMRRRVKNAKHVLYVTNSFLQKRYPTKGKSIACSNVELAVAEDTVLDTRKDKINTYSQDTQFVVGTAAGLDVLYKGQQYVIEAMGLLAKKGITNIEYRLIGGGTGEHLKAVAEKCGVSDRVKIVGQLPHDKVFDFLDSLDIYAQPSRQEGLPRSVIEAMSRGLVCIGARTAGIPELLDDECVFSNSSTEVEEICTILTRLISNKEEMQQKAERNFLEAKKYARATLVERRTRFFKDFAEQHQ
jgi:glycosyltransferase involved in cell wall biosynthesis